MVRMLLTFTLFGATALLSPLVATAQDRPVVFVHGIMSAGQTWAGAAARLQARLAITADTPSLSSRASYETQASELQQAVAHRDDSLVAVGHSNGGIVSRELSRRRQLSGVVTLGTPNQGAPIVSNLYAASWFNGQILSATNNVCRAFAVGCCDWHWILSMYSDLLSAVASAATASLGHIAGAVALNAAIPVSFEMQQGSAFLADLNAPANLAREASAIPGRVGIVSTARNFYYGGMLRAAFPDDGDTLYLIREAARIGMEAYAAYIYAHAPFEDWWAFEIADGMINVAHLLGVMDGYWCYAVSDAGWTGCYVNDTVVPGWSQMYPGAGYIDTGWGGPAHGQQTRMSDPLLEQALTVYMGVRPRGVNPPPPQSAVTLYDDVGLFGASLELGSDSTFVGWEWNDRISSVRVPVGRTVTLFEHADFAGESVTLSGDVDDLRQYPGPGADGTWNDATSSILVR
jgi:pimeloyl-ACP methyl ester carboxylesterase